MPELATSVFLIPAIFVVMNEVARSVIEARRGSEDGRHGVKNREDRLV